MKSYKGLGRLRILASVISVTGLYIQQHAVAADDSRLSIDISDWNVSQPRGTTREIEFMTEEGTSMSVDISPDGRWIIFDLLGHIYRMPAGGGDAYCLTQDSGVAMNFHPRYSPDGRQIAFISDRSGQEGLWVMGVDGSTPQPIAIDAEARFLEPAWSRDGAELFVTKRLQTEQAFYRTQATLWRYTLDGEGEPVVDQRPSQTHWSSVSPDGRYLYFHSSTFTGQGHHLQRISLQDGSIQDVTPPKPTSWVYDYRTVGEVAPEVSPDGLWLAFARKIPGSTIEYRGHRYGPRTGLWLRDLTTGKERLVMDPVEVDLADFHVPHRQRVLPGYAWSSDGKSLVISQGGQIRRLWLENGKVETIPFRASVKRTVSEQAHGEFTIADDVLRIHAPRWPASSPDGGQLVFEAVGRLWIAELPASERASLTPRRLLGDNEQHRTDQIDDVFEQMPAWSTDGEWIAFVTWRHDEQGGHVWKVRTDGSKPVRLTEISGEYSYPVWSSDGKSLFINRWDPAIERTAEANGWEVVRLPANGGAARTVARPGVLTRRGADDEQIYYSRYDEERDETDLVALNPRTGAQDTVAFSIDGAARSVVVSPSGDWAAIQQTQNVYLGRRSSDGELVEVQRLSRPGGFHPRWRNAGTVEWLSSNVYHSYDTMTGRSSSYQIDLVVPRNVPVQTLALTGARIITLGDQGVIEVGTILVEGNRIKCVGTCAHHQADRVIDAQGKTIMPGWVDVHAHHLGLDTIDAHKPALARFLAFGVTTVHDPCADPFPEVGFGVGEIIAAGRLIGPRTFSTGECLRPWAGIHRLSHYQDAKDHVERLADLGALSIKSYAQPSRFQRQWLIDAARQRGVAITAEGQGLFFNLGLAMDGTTGWEHWLHEVPVYSDVATFFGQAGVYWSPQIYRGSFPHQPGVEFWLSQENLLANEKLRRFSAWQDIAMRDRIGKQPLENYSFPIMAEAAKDVRRAGGTIAVGGHSEAEGLDSHWEVWSYAMAADPLEALHAATMGGAGFLGLDSEIGSIETGKIADLLVLNSNPLENIRNTTDIQYVVVNGTVRQADSLDEVWPGQRRYGKRFWYVPDAIKTDNKPLDAWDKGDPVKR